MNRFKRWTTSITSSFDWIVGQVENHEALVSAAIREMQAAGGKARVQHERVKRDGERMVQRIAELNELETVWAERALRCSAQSKEDALECLNRRRIAAKERASLESQLQRHKDLTAQLAQDLRKIDEQLAELRRKKNTMTARQYRAEALRASQLGELGIVGDIDELFERWEMKLGDYDSIYAGRDSFESTFVNTEAREDLEAELQALIAAGRK